MYKDDYKGKQAHPQVAARQLHGLFILGWNRCKGSPTWK